LFFYSYHELNYYINTGQFQKAVKRVEQMEENFPVYGNKFSPAKRAVLYITFAVAYFGNKNFKKSIYNLNQIRNEPLGGVRTDIESLAHLIYLIVHYEKGSDLAFQQSLVRSTYRFLLKRNRLYKFEECILNFIRKKLSKVQPQQEPLQSFRELKKEIILIMKDPFEQGIIQDFDFVSWLESKIEGRSFAEIVREKAK
jgi:tetratricopeptide (TPR) repeat protein